MGLFTKNWRDPYRRMSDGELLERIRTDDRQAENYLMETYLPGLESYMVGKLSNKPQQLGDAGDYAHDAILLLWQRARNEGAAVLRHDHSTIEGWLRQTAQYLLKARERKDQRFLRDFSSNDVDDDDQPQSVMARLIDEGADAFAGRPIKEADEIIREVVDSLEKKLKTLVQKRLLENISWSVVATIMVATYPDNDPPFELAYLQKTYWDRIHKKPFYKTLIDAFKRYGYDF